MQRMPQKMRRGFTLAEMLVVIVIVMLLAATTAPVALDVAQGDRVRDAAGTLQGALASARDRATSVGSPVGIRLLPMSANANDPTSKYVSTLMFIRRAPPISDGTAMVVHSTWNGAGTPPASVSGWPSAMAPTDTYNKVVLLSADVERLRDLPNDGTNSVNMGGNRTYYGSIRFGYSGKVYDFVTCDSWLTGSYPYLILNTSLFAPVPFGIAPTGLTPPDAFDLTNSASTINTLPPAIVPNPATLGTVYQIQVGNVPLDDAQPVNLPKGIIIDLTNVTSSQAPAANGLSQIYAEEVNTYNATYPCNYVNYFDIMFSPSGRLVGSGVSVGQIVLWLHEITANVDTVTGATSSFRLVRSIGGGKHSMVAVNTRTGFVQSYAPNLIDVYNDLTGASVADGYFDYRSYYDLVRAGSGGGL